MEPNQFPVVISAANGPVTIVYRGEGIDLPSDERAAIEVFWEDMLAQGGLFTRGDVFSIVSFEALPEGIRMVAHLSDYAHYLYTVRHGAAHPCRVAHTAVLATTADEYVVLGRMGVHTVAPGKLQCPGGGLTRDDLRGETIDVFHNAATELFEETGLRHDDPAAVASMRLAWVKTGGRHDFIGLVYEARLNRTADEVQALFATHNAALEAQSEMPEFSELIFVRDEPAAIAAFLASEDREMNEVLAPLLQRHAAALAAAGRS